MSAKRILIVRHGETDYNASHRIQGHLETDLNATGRQQAQRLADYLVDEPLTAIYSSDLKRALDTARPVAQHHELDIIPDVRLREINLGQFQGLTFREIEELYPLPYSYWRNRDTAYIFPGGESYDMLQARMIAAWEDIVATDSNGSVMIVTHGGSIRMLIKGLFGEQKTAGLGISNTSLTVLSRHQNTWQIEHLASTRHLNR